MIALKKELDVIQPLLRRKIIRSHKFPHRAHIVLLYILSKVSCVVLRLADNKYEVRIV